ncbi:Aldehyde dehydrogenase [Geobacillus sp. WSUCF1]|nr:Aldehyde dehydrogenase [Geobacillus sp. WSUCF1]
MTVRTKQQTYLNYINGQWVPSASGKTEASLNPADIDDIVGYVQESSAEDVNAAVEAARRAQAAWRKLSGPKRGEYLFRAADVLEKRLDEIAETMTREMGKTLPEAKGRCSGESIFCATTLERGCDRSVRSFHPRTAKR